MSTSSSERWWQPFREIGAASIVHIDLTPHQQHETAALSWLDAKETERWRKFEHPGARRRFALCRVALRSILCDALDCDNEQLTFGELQHGKPFALVNSAPASISFNVSHSGGHGLIAVASEGRLGVDIEERARRRDFDRLIGAAFGPREQSELKLARARGDFHLFFKIWTLKEALIKALGTGMSLDPSTFEAPESIRHGAVASVYRFPHLPTIEWRVEDLGTNEFAAAIAYDV